jgi:hypothetical protein
MTFVAFDPSKTPLSTVSMQLLLKSMKAFLISRNSKTLFWSFEISFPPALNSSSWGKPTKLFGFSSFS